MAEALDSLIAAGNISTFLTNETDEIIAKALEEMLGELHRMLYKAFNATDKVYKPENPFFVSEELEAVLESNSHSEAFQYGAPVGKAPVCDDGENKMIDCFKVACNADENINRMTGFLLDVAIPAFVLPNDQVVTTTGGHSIRFNKKESVQQNELRGLDTISPRTLFREMTLVRGVLFRNLYHSQMQNTVVLGDGDFNGWLLRLYNLNKGMPKTTVFMYPFLMRPMRTEKMGKLNFWKMDNIIRRS